MKLNVYYLDREYHFELVSVGGSQAQTKTVGDAVFSSSITVSLQTEPGSMTDLYHLLIALTQNAWHGFIPINPEHIGVAVYSPTFMGWHVRKPLEGESGTYICQINYNIMTPKVGIDYQIQE